MKVKVLRKFRDKYTKQVYDKGRIIEVANERYEEINSTAHGILVQAIEEEINLEDMTKKEIIKYAEKKGIELNPRMTKADMIKELS